jgi:hypothetical protein
MIPVVNERPIQEDNSFFHTHFGTTSLGLTEKVKFVIKNILPTIVAIYLFPKAIGPILTGLFIGFAITQEMLKVIKSIQNIWNKIRAEEHVVIQGFMLISAAAGWPITLSVSSFFLASYCGAQCRKLFNTIKKTEETSFYQLIQQTIPTHDYPQSPIIRPMTPRLSSVEHIRPFSSPA